ncbi:MAG: hypothetical protein ACI9JN_002731, partial [Bacteroidia bacterium]
MQEKNFEHQVKDLLYDHQEAAPDVMSKVFEKRTPLYVFRNRLILNKYKLLAASLVIGLVIVYFGLVNKPNNQIKEAVVSSETTQSQSVEQQAQRDATELTDLNTSTQEQVTETTTDVATTSPNVVEGTSESTPSVLPSVAVIDNGAQIETQSQAIDNQIENQVQNANDLAVSESSTEVNHIDAANNIESTNPQIIVVEQPDVSNDNQQSESKELPVVVVANDQSDVVIAASDKDVSEEASNDAGEATDDAGEFEMPKTKLSNWSVSLGYGLGLGNRTLDNAGDKQIVAARNNSESQKLSYTTDLFVNY